MTRVLALGAAAMLLAALLPWPYAYYQLLRVVVFLTGGYLAFERVQSSKADALAWGLVAAALIFNPFAPVHLTRAIWSVLNLAAAAVFGYFAWDRK